ncbi:MAG: DNA polymerase III subunit delta [Alistipes sp.]|nr:DNA polymerase III subunit delta [Alistipes sp.]
MQFKEILGQQPILRHLAASVARNRVSHALLFTGPSGTGALPIAVAFAQYLNCPHRHDGESCGVCPSCLQMQQLTHPDVHFVFPVNTPKGSGSSEKPLSDHYLDRWRALFLRTGGYFDEPMWYSALEIDNKQGNISAFEADQILHKLSFKSFESEFKIVILWLPERMNLQAANKLLKIIEEPWDKTLFLFVTEAPDKLLSTLLSRTQSIQIPMLQPEEIARYLIATHHTPEQEAHKVSHLCQGDLLEAERLIDEQQHPANDYLELFIRLMRLSYEDRHMELLEWADTVATLGREEQKQMLENFIRLLRDSYMLTAGVHEIAFLFGREYDFCKKFAPFVNNRNIEALVAEMERALQQVAQNGNPRMIFPHFALSISKMIGRI